MDNMQTNESVIVSDNAAFSTQNTRRLLKNTSRTMFRSSIRSSVDFKNNNRFNSTFTSSLQGFISEKQSANTMRNSLIPISFPKEERFKQPKKAGAVAPFYTIKDVFEKNDNQFKKGWGFGFSERRVFDKTKYAYIPAPDNYYNGKTFSEFYKEKLSNKCTFGEPYERMKRRVDIDNRKNLDFITLDTLSPANYNP